MRVYAMVTEQAGRARFVKFGMASDHKRRAMEVQCGCPLRIETIISVECQTDDLAIALEAALHLEFRDVRCSGEWFRWASPSKAIAEAAEALTLIGQRELGSASVLVERLPRAPIRTAVSRGRYRNATARALAAAPVVGDLPLDQVQVTTKRRKPAPQAA